eukprot:Unigene8874_Nuclearia_a/m.27145 Unigene8874_Nuclearia_a/g.27145  ORF Unigene8874_Nuclearia_a/g.27145 Unigene8874_Nuclearia_a/m.27145 type:complete len:101 (+) Unigene8874_Nuclearia_a:81-383(+)
MRLTNITSIAVAFSPFAPGRGTATARAFLNRVTSDKLRQSNPKCAVQTVVLPPGDAAGARILVTYTDGGKTELRPDEFSLKQILEQLAYNEERFPEEVEA